MKSKKKKDFYWDFYFVRSAREFNNLIAENRDDFSPYDWLQVTKSQYFTDSMIDMYSEHIDWDYLCVFRKMSMKTLEKYSDKLDWHAVSGLQDLTMAFIKNHEKELSFNKLITNSFIISSPYFNEVQRMYEQRKNNKKYTDRWADNISNSPTFRPIKPMKAMSITYYAEEDLKGKSKAQLKEILSKVGVRTYYHDTLDMLRDKIVGKVLK